jgi:hypothetical protein
MLQNQVRIFESGAGTEGDSEDKTPMPRQFTAYLVSESFDCPQGIELF